MSHFKISITLANISNLHCGLEFICKYIMFSLLLRIYLKKKNKKKTLLLRIYLQIYKVFIAALNSFANI